VNELARKIGGVLREPSGSVMALGPLSFLGGLSLWITIPLILMGLTVISVVVWNLIPFFVAAIVMLITYWVVSHFGMRDPWRHVLPVIFGLIALMPAFMGWVHRIASSSVATAAATHAQAVQAQGILESLLAKVASGPLAFAAFAVLIFLAIGLASLVRLGSIGAFVAGFLSLALGIGLALNVTGLGAAQALGFGGVSPLAKAGYKYSEVSKGKITDGGKVWKWHSAPWGKWNDSFWEADIIKVKKKEDNPIGSRPTDGKVKVTYRWKSKVKISTTRWREAFGEKFKGQSAKISVTPPTQTYRTVGGKRVLSQTSYELVSATVNCTGPVSASGGVVKDKIRLASVSSTAEGSGTIEIIATFEKTVTKRKGEKIKNPGGGTDEGKGPLNKVPMYLWVIIPSMACVPAAVYAYEAGRR